VVPVCAAPFNLNLPCSLLSARWREAEAKWRRFWRHGWCWVSLFVSHFEYASSLPSNINSMKKKALTL